VEGDGGGPQQPGWSLTSIYYHTSVSARAGVARAREFEIGQIPVNITATGSASLNAKADLGLVMPTYAGLWRPAYGWCHWNLWRRQHVLAGLSDRHGGLPPLCAISPPTGPCSVFRTCGLTSESDG